MDNHVSGKDKLIVLRPIIVRPFSIGMIVPKLRADRNKLVRPPGDADGMLGIICSKASATADLVVKIFIAYGKEGVWCDPKHGVVHNRPFGRVTVLDRK